MRHQFMLLLVCSGVLGLPAYSQDPPRKAEFELQVGKSTYEVTEGQALSVMTPGGERVEVILRRKEVLQFSDHGISFNYPSSMSVVSEKDLGFATITVESTKSYMALIQVYSVPTSAEAVRSALVAGLREEFSARKAEFLEGAGRSVRQTINGVERTGQTMEFLLAGEHMKVEVYAFPKEGRVIALVLQHLTEEGTEAERAFNVITAALQ